MFEIHFETKKPRIYKGSWGRFESPLVLVGYTPKNYHETWKSPHWKTKSSSTTSSSGLVHVSSELVFGRLTYSQEGNPRISQNGAQQMDGWLHPNQTNVKPMKFHRRIKGEISQPNKLYKTHLWKCLKRMLCSLNKKLCPHDWHSKKTDPLYYFPLTLQFWLIPGACLVGTTTSSVSSVSPLRRGARRRSAPTYPAYPAHDSRK